MEAARRTPLRTVSTRDGFAGAGMGWQRQNVANPATSDAADEAMEPKDLARSAKPRTGAVIDSHSLSNWARFNSLSAINMRFRNSSGLR